MKRWCSAILGGALLASASAQQSDVLFIGNSYTYVNDLPNTFRQLALSLGDTVNVAMAAPGGYTFQDHTVDAATLAAISSQNWDYVVLQEQSQLPSFPPEQVEEECYPFAAQLVDDILANDSCTQPVFYMTWGRQNGDLDNCDTWPPVCTYEGMQQLLRERYLEMAFANEAFAAPVGVAWKHVRDTHPLINLYNPDQSHPSLEGTYLAACVFYSTLFRQSSVGATFTAALDPDTAAILRTIASSTVLDSLDTWNIGVNDPDAGFTADASDLGWNYHFQPNDDTGAHHWDFGNGESSEETSPTHFMCDGDDSPHELLVVHTVTDPCGRSASSSQEIPVCGEGIMGDGPARRPFVDLIDGQMHFTGLLPGDDITILDATGRILFRGTASSTDLSLTTPKGLMLWRIFDIDERTTSGRLICP